ncbi:hypothetical protein B0H15DRAFT_952609 [Mycena belliarum]|uniref:Uncharacterized protein n=1 Tax=Mycena belliarum TaxID=1033014 RepID=A0AAD6TYT8_9AGAR|nr:hypothetical protein B0H15DRAFT_952609 [Mycena belliae]
MCATPRGDLALPAARRKVIQHLSAKALRPYDLTKAKTLRIAKLSIKEGSHGRGCMRCLRGLEIPSPRPTCTNSAASHARARPPPLHLVPGRNTGTDFARGGASLASVSEDLRWRELMLPGSRVTALSREAQRSMQPARGLVIPPPLHPIARRCFARGRESGARIRGHRAGGLAQDAMFIRGVNAVYAQAKGIQPAQVNPFTFFCISVACPPAPPPEYGILLLSSLLLP